MCDKSEMSTRFSPSSVESKWYKKWEDNNAFGSQIDDSKTPYTIVIPPPNVTGILHMGHALNNTLQDIVIRFRRMQGMEALWIPGTDHAGIATQNVVERKLAKEGLTRDEVGREKFLEHVWEWKEQYGGTILNQLRSLGNSCDWSRTRFTMDDGLSLAVRQAFVTLFNDGLIYRGHRLVNWCPRCQTALADDEVENEPSKGHLWYLKYPVKDSRDRFVVVATTRPETMLGDTGVAVNPNDERYKDLIGSTLVLPLLEREIPIVADDAVDPQFGTGAVKVTPAHDFTDFEMGARHNLESIQIMEADATMNSNAGPFSGLGRFEARDKVVEALNSRGLLEKTEDYENTHPHCYRCATIVEPRLSDQWFVNMRELAGPAIEVAERGKLKFHPPRWKREYLRWLENVQDWCISRQIWWGHRIPVWTCRDCEKVIAAVKTPESCPQCRSTDLEQDSDVLDTWFSSSLWPFSTLGWPNDTADLEYYYPTSTLITDRGILYFWVARMVIMGLRLVRNVPFTDVYINSTILDEKGHKMSKSAGNGIDPLDMIKEYGTDAVRASLVLLSTEQQDLKLAPTKFEMGRNFANKVWNVARFAIMRIAEEPPQKAPLPEELDFADRWILSRLQRTIKDATTAFDEFHYNDAITKIYEFVWNEFCAWYVELAKFRLNEGGRDGEVARSVLAYVLNRSLKILHPVCPFITEEIYSRLRELPITCELTDDAKTDTAELIINAEWPVPLEEFIDDELEATMSLMQEAITAVRNIRSSRNVPPKEPIAVSISAANTDIAALFRDNTDMISNLTRAGELTIGVELERPQSASVAVLNGAQVFVPIKIDVKAERARLEKQLEEDEGFLRKVDGRLHNPQYLDRAPAEVVERDRKTREEVLQRIETLHDNLKALGE